MTTIPLHKSIAWAYPTSPNAARFGFGRTGCWVVDLQPADCSRPPEAVSAHACESDAIDTALSMPNEWTRLYLQFHPEISKRS